MKKCFVGFVSSAAQLNCNGSGAPAAAAPTDTTAAPPTTTAAATDAPATASGGTRHLQATSSPTIAGPTPVERAFIEECGQQIQGCGAAPECRACVQNAVKVSSLRIDCTAHLYAILKLFAQFVELALVCILLIL
jgi:hypothetical protein